MQTFSAATIAALQAGMTVPRDFLWIEAKSRLNGGTKTMGFWSDDHDVSADVVDPDSLNVVTQPFVGAGGMISYDAVSAACDLSVQPITVKLAQVADPVNLLVRTWDVRLAPVTMWSGLLSLDSRKLIEPARCVFRGFVDGCEIETPQEGDDGSCTLTLASDAQEMSRSNPAKRSNADQHLRDPNDDFFQYPGCGKWTIFWGKEGGTLEEAHASFERIGGWLLR